MASVINIGVVPSPNPSNFDGLAEALATGLQLREQKRSNKAREALEDRKQRIDTALGLGKMQIDASLGLSQLDENKRANAVSEALSRQRNSVELMRMHNEKKNYEAQARIDTVKNDLAKEKETKERLLKEQEKLSAYLANKNDQEKEMYWTSDQGKEVSKLFKAYLPELIDEKGRVMVDSKEAMIEKGIEGFKLNLAKKIQSGIPLTPEDKAAVEMLNNTDEKTLTAVLQTIGNDIAWSTYSPEEKQKRIQGIIEQIKGIREASSSGIDYFDPLGILSKNPVSSVLKGF